MFSGLGGWLSVRPSGHVPGVWPSAGASQQGPGLGRVGRKVPVLSAEGHPGLFKVSDVPRVGGTG